MSCSNTEDNYYELEVKPVFEHHGMRLQGPCARLRMNLLAVSDRDKNIMFVALEDTIFVHRLNLINSKPSEPIKKLKCPTDSERSQNPTINAIKVGKIGNEEVLVSVDDVGDIRIWFTANLDKNPIQFSNNESTWGIALHGPKRLLAVSANSHEITIFNLKESVKFFNEFDDDDDNSESSSEEESQTPKTYASVLTKISENDALGGKAISVLRGHEHNIPNICFSACGRFLVSCSIDTSCRVWNIKTGELIQTKMLTGDWYDLNESDEWGWSANFVPKSAFKTVSSNCEACQHLISNPASVPSSPRSVETMDSLDLYRQHLNHNLAGQRPNVRAAEDLYRMIINRRIRSREYEDGYIEDGAYFESGSELEESESNEDDSELESNGDDSDLESNEDDSELESSEGDKEIGSNNSEVVDQHENNGNSSNRERLIEIEGSATPAYYDRTESTTPVVENYTENNPDYRWSVGHELNILNNNHEENENNSSLISEREIERNNNEERTEEIIEERSNQSTQNNTYGSSIHLLYSPRSHTISEDSTPAPSHSTNFSPETSVSPSYSPVSPEYIPANREPSPHRSFIVDVTLPSLNIRNDSSPERHEIEPIPQSSHTNTVHTPINEMNENNLDVTVHDNDTICSDDSLTIVSRTPPIPSSSREGVNSIDSSPRTSNDYTHDRSRIHFKRIQPLGSSQSDCCPDLGLPDELVLYTKKHDLLLLDPKSNLKVLRTEKDIVCKIDTRRFPIYADYDRLNMVEVIPELSLMIVASQQGKIALTRLIKIVNDNGDENYYLYPEKYLPSALMNTPLLGMFVAKHNTLQDPALFYYRLHLMYCNGVMFCYEIRRKKETNPLRMDNIFI